MFELLKKYGHKVAHVAHELAEIIEKDGALIVEALRLAAKAIPGLRPIAGALDLVAAAADAASGEASPDVIARLEAAAGVVHEPPPLEPGPGWRNPLRGLAPAVSPEVAPVVAPIVALEAGPTEPTPAAVFETGPGWRNPLRG